MKMGLTRKRRRSERHLSRRTHGKGAFNLTVGHAAQIWNMPDRKTDVKDEEWTAELVRYGLRAPANACIRPCRLAAGALRSA